MKKIALFVVASFAILSFSAVAGENCIYGQGAKMAEANAEHEELDPELLAKLKREQELLEKASPYPTFN